MSDFLIILLVWMIKITFIVSWVAGMVIANGFWSTFFAIILPPWGWYLLVEKLLIYSGII